MTGLHDWSWLVWRAAIFIGAMALVMIVSRESFGQVLCATDNEWHVFGEAPKDGVYARWNPAHTSSDRIVGSTTLPYEVPANKVLGIHYVSIEGRKSMNVDRRLNIFAVITNTPIAQDETDITGIGRTNTQSCYSRFETKICRFDPPILVVSGKYVNNRVVNVDGSDGSHSWQMGGCLYDD